jgi:(p)ppGpp synthase/HD superfamily hydrolase
MEYKTALSIAQKAHAGQKDKTGADYILHPLAVAESIAFFEWNLQCEQKRIAAMLHDVVEDSPVTLDDLRTAGISEEVVAAVDCLTKRDGETLDAYFARIRPNHIAHQVKVYDMKHNMDVSRWPVERMDEAFANREKYAERLQRLFKW